MAGLTSSKGLLLVGAILLILAWKTASYYGADYFLLRRLGAPWKRRISTELDASGQIHAPKAA
jgi:hypothetical protein